MPADGPAGDTLIVRYREAGTWRKRSVGNQVLQGRVELPIPPPRLKADWTDAVLHTQPLAPGDVAPLNLPRARLRWPDYRLCVQRLADAMDAAGLPGVLRAAVPALMACRGARYHLDAERYGAFAFCNLIVQAAPGLDLHFPANGLRMPLERGSLVLFDTGQPHAVIDRARGHFDAADFPETDDRSLVFLTWELPVAQADVARRLGIHLDRAQPTPARQRGGPMWRNGRPARLCPQTGRWL